MGELLRLPSLHTQQDIGHRIPPIHVPPTAPSPLPLSSQVAPFMRSETMALHDICAEFFVEQGVQIVAGSAGGASVAGLQLPAKSTKNRYIIAPVN